MAYVKEATEQLTSKCFKYAFIKDTAEGSGINLKGARNSRVKTADLIVDHFHADVDGLVNFMKKFHIDDKKEESVGHTLVDEVRETQERESEREEAEEESESEGKAEKESETNKKDEEVVKMWLNINPHMFNKSNVPPLSRQAFDLAKSQIDKVVGWYSDRMKEIEQRFEKSVKNTSVEPYPSQNQNPCIRIYFEYKGVIPLEGSPDWDKFWDSVYTLIQYMADPDYYNEDKNPLQINNRMYDVSDDNNYYIVRNGRVRPRYNKMILARWRGQRY